MPQMNKGGKFIFGKSIIRADGTVQLPPQAIEEYHISAEGKVYLFTGSKITGGLLRYPKRTFAFIKARSYS